jgi:predicted nuclease with RNAse H fold
MSSVPVFVGIDVACAVNKRLPICIVSAGWQLTPMMIPKNLAAKIPRGVGNKEITAGTPFREAAHGVASALKSIASNMGWQVERVAVDAPAAAPETGSRLSENELGQRGLSSFRTPATAAWLGIREKCIEHLNVGGGAATLPHANKIWMLFGFELFAALRERFEAEVVEVYPFAIVRALLPTCLHKSTEKGYRDQLVAVASRTGWEPSDLEARLRARVAGSRHDRLDAFMAAWVASLPQERRCAFGDPGRPDDAIWVPR